MSKLIDSVRDSIRLKHYSPRTIAAYTQREVQSILTAMPDDELRLMAQHCNGSGLRLMECVRLRTKDVDLASQRITVRDTKSNRGRTPYHQKPSR